jgi:predicted component of type VI protein secretion system
MFTLKKVLKVVRRETPPGNSRQEFLENFHHRLKALHLDTLRRHRDGSLYTYQRNDMFKIIDRLDSMVESSLRA